MDIQAHIHLSDALSGAPEYSPDWKWKVRVDGWLYEPNTVSEHKRTLTGVLKKHTMKTTGGDVIQFLDHRYIIRVDDYWGKTAEERLAKLVSLQNKDVYLVDIMHSVDDDQNHTGFVKQMYVASVFDVTPINPQLSPLYVGIQLIDDNTVT